MSALGRMARVVVVALCVCAQEASAQVKLDLVAGLATSRLAGADSDAAFGERKGLHLGGFANLPLISVLSVAPGALYIEKGYQYPGGTPTVKLAYLEISAPIRLTLPVGSLFSVVLFGGPGFALEFGCLFREDVENVERSIDCTGADFDFRGWDVTGMVGGGLSIPVSGTTSLVVNGALDQSLRSIDSGSPRVDLRHRTVLINAGVSFPIEVPRAR